MERPGQEGEGEEGGRGGGGCEEPPRVVYGGACLVGEGGGRRLAWGMNSGVDTRGNIKYYPTKRIREGKMRGR